MNKEKYDMKPIVATMDNAIAKLSMNKKAVIEKWSFNLDTSSHYDSEYREIYRNKFLKDLDKFENHIKKECAKELIDKIFIGVDRKYTVGWHSYFKIGNQTFYMTTCETKKDAKWFADQLTHAIMSIAKTIKGNK